MLSSVERDLQRDCSQIKLLSGLPPPPSLPTRKPNRVPKVLDVIIDSDEQLWNIMSINVDTAEKAQMHWNWAHMFQAQLNAAPRGPPVGSYANPPINTPGPVVGGVLAQQWNTWAQHQVQQQQPVAQSLFKRNFFVSFLLFFILFFSHYFVVISWDFPLPLLIHLLPSSSPNLDLIYYLFICLNFFNLWFKMVLIWLVVLADFRLILLVLLIALYITQLMKIWNGLAIWSLAGGFQNVVKHLTPPSSSNSDSVCFAFWRHSCTQNLEQLPSKEILEELSYLVGFAFEYEKNAGCVRLASTATCPPHWPICGRDKMRIK